MPRPQFAIFDTRLLISRFPRAFFFSALAATALAAPPYTALLKEASAAVKAGDMVTALARAEEAAKLRPDYPRLQLNLARFYADAKRPDGALAALQRLADMGVRINPADPGLAPLQDLPRFRELAARFTAPVDEVGLVSRTSIDHITGILEGLLVDPTTGAWYFSDVRQRCIWRREESGLVRKFSSDADELDGVFRLALSPDHRTLWASTATVGAMGGAPAPEGSRSALVELDAATGRVRARHAVPDDGRKHLLGDFTFAADGAIFATDSFSPVIWRLPPDGAAPEVWLQSDDFLNLQGIVFSPDGKALYVSDYSNGVWRIDATTKETMLLTAPPNATFFGIDGLAVARNGLVAIQNGIEPQRVLLIKPAPAGQPSAARVLAAGHPAMTDLSLGVITGDRFRFIADSGWALYDPPPPNPPPARAVTVYSVGLE